MKLNVDEIYNILNEDRDFFLQKKNDFIRCAGTVSSDSMSDSSVRTVADKLFLSLFSFKDDNKSIDRLIRQLLKYNIDIKPDLTNFLMGLMNDYLDYCLKNKKSVKNVKALMYLVNHYISMIDKAYVSYINRISKNVEVLKKEKSEANKELALSIFKGIKDDKKPVRIISYYKEVPIICKSYVKKVTDEFVVLEYENCSVKAFHTDKNVYVKTDAFSKKIKATIINISPKDEVIVLGKFEITELPQEKRKFVRVEPSETIDIFIQHGNERLKGKIADISIGGVGVYLKDIEDLEEDDIVRVEFKLDSEDLSIEGRIRYIVDMDGIYRVGIELFPDVNTEEKISDYVINRQFEILREIKSS